MPAACSLCAYPSCKKEVSKTRGKFVVNKCVLQAPNQVPGLSLPDTSGSCTNSCKPYAGEIGTSVTVSDTSICMPTSEAGGTNHFGGLTSGKCSYASGSGVSQTAAYSCVCTYGGSTEPAGPTASNATPPAGLTQLSTAG